MKIIKGSAGYIPKQKKKLLIITIIEFSLVAALLILGIVETGSRLNFLTVFAVLGCLPAAKQLIQWIVILPYHTIEDEHVQELENIAQSLTKSYDMVVTDEKHFMPIESLVISDNTVCGYASNPKTNANDAGKHILSILKANKYDKVSVKIFDDYKAYMSRVKDMNDLALQNGTDTTEKEENIKHIILQISL